MCECSKGAVLFHFCFVLLFVMLYPPPDWQKKRRKEIETFVARRIRETGLSMGAWIENRSLEITDEEHSTRDSLTDSIHTLFIATPSQVVPPFRRTRLFFFSLFFRIRAKNKAHEGAGYREALHVKA